MLCDCVCDEEKGNQGSDKKNRDFEFMNIQRFIYSYTSFIMFVYL